jgi:toxin ParE1/3/4
VSRRPFLVEWTEAALGDLDRLAVYLANEAPLRAEEVLDRIIARAESLDVVPERGRFPPELRLVHNQTWREVQEPPWRILYRINGRIVEVHGVLDGRRSLQDILMERLLNA